MRRAVWVLAAALAACDLQEVTIAESDDVVVAEITLRAGELAQRALLHRTTGDGRVANARIEVTNARGQVLRFEPTNPQFCLESRAIGSCYSANTTSFPIIPGETYSLRIQTSDGRVMTAATRVPDDFIMRRPATPVCSLPANTTFPIVWTASPAAWVYVSETLIYGLEPFLASKNIKLEESPLRAFGLSISNQDTTVVFPTQLGLFQRFDPELTEALVAIQGGLPPNTHADVLVAAADRNYVNWERGGNFNPSGLIRVPSIRGQGTGTFGSLVPKKFEVFIGRPDLPDC